MTSTLATLSHPKAGRPAASYIYRNQDGVPVLIANRFNKPDGGKFFIPFDVIRSDWKAPDCRPLYNLDKITQADPAEPVVLVEGEKCADALSALGYLATTTYGGCNALRKADLSPLRNRTVTLWPDLDAPSLAYVEKAALTLHRDLAALPRIVPISDSFLCKVMLDSRATPPANAPTYCKGWDAADAIADGWDKTKIDRLLSYAVPPEGANTNAEPVRPRGTASDPMDIEVWKTPDGEPYATLRIDGHFEHWPIASATFKKYLSFQHYQATEKMLSQSALDDQRRTYEGQALFGGDVHPVFNRIGTLGRTLYVDLGCADWKAIAINSEGWQIIDHPPARFTRARSMQPLPKPSISGGDINLLRPFLNTATEADFQMLVAWLIGCFHPKGPYPILILNGEQGSAKSTTARVLRNLIDPSNPIARSAPSSEQDLVIAAKHNHVLAFDNLSTIRPMMADAFCRIATGGGFGTRKLHTDADEMLFSATRPCLLNGIPDLAGRPDLADRAIVVTLPVIAPSERAFEGEFNKALDAAVPRILAGLLDASQPLFPT
ncbi:MAG: hypothetical protein ABNH26_00050 [Celeribacter sp.]|jgi:hypothetical protein